MQSIKKIPGYELVWSDEFDKGIVDPENWNIETHPAGWENGELQEFVDDPENLFVKDGQLHLLPRRHVTENGEVRYSSARLNTQGKREFKYGRFEARIKVPSGKGLLPVFRIMSDDKKYGAWPKCGSMEVMEILGEDTGKQYGAIHYGVPRVTQLGTYKFPIGDDPAAEFHTYGVEWEPGTVKWMVDGMVYFECSQPEGIDHPFFPVLSLVIGGVRANDPDDSTVFGPASAMVVDYVRVYRKKHYEERKPGRKRKLLGICGVWEDAENFNLFVRALLSPEVTRDYVISAFTFGIPSDVSREVDVEKKFAEFICTIDLSGIVIFAEMIKNEDIIDRLIASARKRRIPVMVFEREYKNCVNLQLDYSSGFEQMVRHVVEHHGCTRVDMFAGFRGNPYSEARIGIYKNVLEQHGIKFDPERVHYGDFWDAIAERTMTGLIASGYPVPQAIVCANDSMAVGVCDSLQKNGIKVPEEVLVTGFDGVWQSYCHNPGITTCEPDYDEMRTTIMKVMGEYKDTSKRKELLKSPLKIGYKKVIRSSCGCAKETYDKWSGIVTSLYNDNHDYFRHILEMGKFVSQTISMSDVVDAADDLMKYLWLWKDQYYFIGIREGDVCVHAIFESYKGEYKRDRKFFNMSAPLPEMDTILAEGSGINVLLFKQARAKDEAFGYIACGYEDLSLRDEQRFEEYSLFVSAVVHSSINNGQLLKANSEIEHMSESDYLTGLLNRRGFFRVVDNALAKPENTGKYFSLFTIDMDGLKQINDTFGHFEGDMAIQSLALAIKTFVGDRGFCARFGGDEFSFVIIGDEPIAPKSREISESINRFVASDGNLKDRPFDVGASLGCSEKIIDGRIDVEEMMREADLAMYKDKYYRKSNI